MLLASLLATAPGFGNQAGHVATHDPAASIPWFQGSVDAAFVVQRLDKALRKWNTGTPHEDVIRAARARMNEICAKGPQVKADPAKAGQRDDASSACRNFLTT